MKSQWMTYEGVRFMYADFSHLGRDLEALRRELEEADAEICKSAPNSALLLIDVRGTVTSTPAVSLFKESAVRTKGFTRKQAIIGVTGIQRILAQAVARFSSEEFMLFDTFDAARDWLVRDKTGGGVLLMPPE